MSINFRALPLLSIENDDLSYCVSNSKEPLVLALETTFTDQQQQQQEQQLTTAMQDANTSIPSDLKVSVSSPISKS
jgi:hypothetical protein